MWRIIHLDTVDSTNEACKRLLRSGDNGPTAVIAAQQTGGKGRRGRSFQSLGGKGLYLSVHFRPAAPPEEVSPVTAWAAVAVCRAVTRVSGIDPGVKWPNDVLAEGKKLCGILTELVGDRVIIGIGVNLTQTPADFGPELAHKAVSLAQLGAAVDATRLETALLEELAALAADFPARREPWLADYRRRCVTLGSRVRLVGEGGDLAATALDVDSDLALLVRLDSGEERRVTSGEVSVRGLLGYV